MIQWQILLPFMILFSGVEHILYRILSKGEKGEYPAFIFQLFGGLIFLLFIEGFPMFSSVWIYPIIASIFYGIANILFFTAYSGGEVSLLSPLGNLTLIIILILSVLFLQETFTFLKIIGIILIVYGLSFLKKRENFLESLKAVGKDRSCQLYFLSVLVFASGRVIDKIAIQYFQPFTYTFLEFSLPSLIVLMFIGFKREISNLIEFTRRKLLLSAWTGLITGSRYVMYLMIISQIELSTASPLGGLSILLSIILAHFILRERVQTRWLGVVSMVVGAGLLIYKT